jgi:4'-phosphopantetheinyl transferase
MPYPFAAHPVVKHILDVSPAHAAGVRLVCVDIDLEATLDHPAFSILAEEERAHASHFLRKGDALRFSATRLALREAIGELQDAHPSSLQFRRDANGRPMLTCRACSGVHDAFDFNVSHSGRYALIALAKGRRVGVDIESLDRQIDWRELAPAVLSPRDRAYVMSLPHHLRGDAFYKVWTAKEAFLKALGTGLAAGMVHFSVLGGVDNTPVAIPAPPGSESDFKHAKRVTAFDATWCPAPEGYTACVAWSREAVPSNHYPDRACPSP